MNTQHKLKSGVELWHSTTFCLLTVIILFSSLRNQAATCSSTGSGDWGNTATWSCGHVPTCGDSIVILAGHSVTISAQQNLSGCGAGIAVAIFGTLKLNGGSKLRLPCGSRFYLLQGSTLTSDGSGSSNQLEICGAGQWDASQGPKLGEACFPATLTSCAVVLPVELIFFEAAICNNGQVCLKWATATERNSKHFEIERSDNGIVFTSLSFVNSGAPEGKSNSKLSYEINDNFPPKGVFYYRLRQVDFDGRSKLSPVISLNYNPSTNISVSIFPNPNSGSFSISIGGLSGDKLIKVVLKNLEGKIMLSKIFHLNESSNLVRIDSFFKMPPGLYFCSVYDYNKEYLSKIIVE